MERLSRSIKPTTMRPIKVVQFGEGNFLRAFVDPFIQTLNEKELFDGNVLVVQPVPMGRVNALKEQDGLYTVVLEGIMNQSKVNEHKLIDVISAFNNPYEDYNGFLDIAGIESLTTIISNTTEAGIVYVEEEIGMAETPNSFPGKLLELLHMRFQMFAGDPNKGLDIIACELIDNNGDELRNVVLKLARFNQLSETFINWITKHNRFYNSLVDRIVPGYPRMDIDKYQTAFNYIDDNLVKCEIFHLWVIEDNYNLKDRLPFDVAGLNVIFTDQIKPYKESKVKILNGSHTAMTPIAYLLGIDTVKEAILDPEVRRFIKTYIEQEAIPTIDLDKAAMDTFAKQVLERFENPFIRHELMSIALNSMSKYKSRVLSVVLEQLSRNAFPKLGLFALAAFIVFYEGKRNGQQIALQDDKHFLDTFKFLWQSNDTKYIVKSVLSMHHWQSERLLEDDVVDYVTHMVDYIKNHGMQQALAHVLESI